MKTPKYEKQKIQVTKSIIRKAGRFSSNEECLFATAKPFSVVITPYTT